MESKYDSYYEEEILYKMNFEELCEANTKNGHMSEREILAYIRHRGEKFRCYARSTVRGTLTPLGIMSSDDDEEMVLCRLVTGKDSPHYNDSAYNPLVEGGVIPRDGNWYCSYKLALTPVEFEGVIDKYYVSDFCSLVNAGHIEIWEPTDENLICI